MTRELLLMRDPNFSPRYCLILPLLLRYHLCGKMEYKEYGMEKWLIQTTILGRLDEAEGTSMEYTEAYFDWKFSMEIAM
jgi:hypothetical protein